MSPLPFLFACRTEAPVTDGDPAPVPLENIALSDEIVCADPTARDALPFDRVEEGDWAERGSSYGAWGVTIADLDQDGWMDVVVPAGLRPMAFLGGPDGLHDARDRFPPEFTADPYRATLAGDVDGDGDLDLIHLGREVEDLVLFNDGAATFTAESFQHGDRTMGGSLGDVDLDGDLDLAIANGTSVTAPVLFLNDGTGRFTARDDLVPEGFEHGSGFVMAIVDPNDDGQPDLYRANDAGPWGPGNLVAWGRNGRFEADPANETGLDVEICSMGLGVGDLNGDLVQDLALSDCSALHLLESTPVGVWTDHALARDFTIHPENAQDVPWGVELADLDNDGNLDVYVAYGFLSNGDWPQSLLERDGVYLQQPDGTFVEQAEAWGIELGQSRGFAVGDVNNDGWLDVVKQDWMGQPEYYRSRCGSESWIRVGLQDDGPNRFAIGAKVVASADGRAIARWVHAGGSGVSSGGPPEAHFGLGDATSVDLEVTWPDGEVTSWEGVPTRRIVTLTR